MKYKLKKPIHISKGKILEQAAEQRGGLGFVELPVAIGKDFTAMLVVQIHEDALASGYFEICDGA